MCNAPGPGIILILILLVLAAVYVVGIGCFRLLAARSSRKSGQSLEKSGSSPHTDHCDVQAHAESVRKSKDNDREIIWLQIFFTLAVILLIIFLRY